MAKALLYVILAGTCVGLFLVFVAVRDGDSDPGRTEAAVARVFRDNAQLEELRLMALYRPHQFPGLNYTYRQGTVFQVVESKQGWARVVLTKDLTGWVAGYPFPFTWDRANSRASVRRSTFLGDYFDKLVIYSFALFPVPQLALILFFTTWSALAVVGCFGHPNPIVAYDETAKVGWIFIVGLAVFLLFIRSYGRVHLNDLAAFDADNEAWSRSFLGLRVAPDLFISSTVFPQHLDLFQFHFWTDVVVVPLLIAAPATAGWFLLTTAKRFFVGLYYVCTPHPAARAVRSSQGGFSDHEAISDIIEKTSPFEEVGNPPSALNSSVLRRKAEALAEHLKRKQAEGGLLDEHEELVLRNYLRERKTYDGE